MSADVTSGSGRGGSTGARTAAIAIALKNYHFVSSEAHSKADPYGCIQIKPAKPSNVYSLASVAETPARIPNYESPRSRPYCHGFGMANDHAGRMPDFVMDEEG